MTTSIIFQLTALVVISLSRIGTAADLLDAPGPGYFQQVERLAPELQSPVRPSIDFAPSMQIHSRPSFSTDTFRGTEQPFSRPIQFFEPVGRTSEPRISGQVKQQVPAGPK